MVFVDGHLVTYYLHCNECVRVYTGFMGNPHPDGATGLQYHSPMIPSGWGLFISADTTTSYFVCDSTQYIAHHMCYRLTYYCCFYYYYGVPKLRSFATTMRRSISLEVLWMQCRSNELCHTFLTTLKVHREKSFVFSDRLFTVYL